MIKFEEAVAGTYVQYVFIHDMWMEGWIVANYADRLEVAGAGSHVIRKEFFDEDLRKKKFKLFLEGTPGYKPPIPSVRRFIESVKTLLP